MLHIVYDSSYYGNNLFPDFYEWLDFLGKMTNKTDYDWYIKTHPDYIPEQWKLLINSVIRNSIYYLLKVYNQLLKEGIDTVLLRIWNDWM